MQSDIRVARRSNGLEYSWLTTEGLDLGEVYDDSDPCMDNEIFDEDSQRACCIAPSHLVAFNEW